LDLRQGHFGRVPPASAEKDTSSVLENGGS
jgi:hypothetical protein